jgi:tripartite-type tricarboxylate transporter receptor subunit TctC
MKLMRRLTLTLSVGFFFCISAMADAPWPKQAIKWVVPFPTGGTVDQISRLMQPFVQQSLGQSVIIDNKVGASGTIGTGIVAKAPADGYTWVMVFDTHSVNPSLYPNLPFDTVKDLRGVMLIGTGAMLITAHASTPYKTYADLVQTARDKPDSIGYGTIGAGSMAHLAMTALAHFHKVSWVHVPYKGGGPLSTDGVAGHVPVTMATYALWAQHLPGGKLRALAVTSPKRMPELPDVPTLHELGVSGFEAQAWWGMLAPAGTPDDIVNKMNAAVANALQEPVVKDRLRQMGVAIAASSPTEMDRFVKQEADKWGKVVRDNKIKPGQ